MDILDSSLLHLFEKVRAWMNLKSDLADRSGDSCTCHEDYSMCSECNLPSATFNYGRRCGVCGRPFCARRMQMNTVSLSSNCKLGIHDTTGVTTLGGDSKVDPLCGAEESENGLACKPDNANGVGNFVHERICSLNILSPADQLPPVSLRCYDKSDDTETCYYIDPNDTEKNFSTPRCDSPIISDIDASSTYSMSDVCSFKSATSSPFHNSSFMGLSPKKVDSPVPDCQLEYDKSQGYVQLHKKQVQISGRSRKNDVELESPACSIDDCSQNQRQKFLLVLDYKNDDNFWFPPEDENEETESTVFESDDEFSGNTDSKFSSNSVGDDIVRRKGKLNEQHKESLRAVIHDHFRALVSQLLKGEGIDAVSGEIEESWVEIVTSLAWKAANFVKPDTNDGGSMDPCDYVKVKCIACGYPRDSVLIKGVVFTKKMKHKRMTSQYKNPKLLLLGALEYERLPNQLASIDTLIHQEMDNIKMKVSKIEAHHPNVVLVEKSVSPRAIEYLLSKDISLVLNVKRSVLERIARSTGAQIIPSVDDLISPMLGQCEIFRLEKFEEYQAIKSPSKKSVKKSLMFLEGCPRRLGCTVLLRGASREKLKKVKHVLQFAIFAAYHLSLETSFLADEGATLPKSPMEPPISLPEKPLNVDRAISPISRSNAYIDTVQAIDRIQASSSLSELTNSFPKLEVQAKNMWTSDFNSENEVLQLPDECADSSFMFASCSTALHSTTDRDMDMILPHRGPEAFVLYVTPSSSLQSQCEKVKDLLIHSSHDKIMTGMPKEISTVEEEALDLASKNDSSGERKKVNAIEGENPSKEFMPTVETHQGIAVLFSRQCLTKGTVCEQYQLLRIKFYGISDKPLGRFLRDDLFNQASPCMSCSQPAEAHVRRYIHQQGSVSMYVNRIPSLNLPGKPEGKIWMWHRCLECAPKDGVSQAKNRVIMSDAAWGLSFGKFLELSFSNNATAKRVANCGHSLQRDCLHYYGCGDTVALFCYDPIHIFTVFLPPPMLQYKSQVQWEWIRKEAADVSEKMKLLYAEVFDALQIMEENYTTVEPGSESMSLNDFISYMAELKILIRTERSEYDSLLRGAAIDNCCEAVSGADIFELAYLRWCLLVDMYVWEHRLHMLDSLVKTTRSPTKFDFGIECINSSASESCIETDTSLRDGIHAPLQNGNARKFYSSLDKSFDLQEDLLLNHSNNMVMLDSVRCAEGSPYTEDPQAASGHLTEASGSMSLECSILHDKIDFAWTGSTESLSGLDTQVSPSEDAEEFDSISPANKIVSGRCRKSMAPMRVYSFDSVLRLGESCQRSLFHTSPRLSPAKSFRVSGDCGSLIKTLVPNMRRFYYRDLPKTSQKFDVILNYTPSFLTSSYHMLNEGSMMLLPSTGRNNIVVALYDNEPTSVITYALSSKEYESFVSDKSIDLDGSKPVDENNLDDSQINFQIGSDDIQLRSYGSDATALSPRRLYGSDSTKSPHFKTSFGDDSLLPGGKVRFTVTCYFAKHFDGLRRKYSPNRMDFWQSLSRCRRWRAQGGKSNVYFAKTMDERFIIKQVIRTELASFEEFSLYYFKYLSDALSSGYPTCLAKVLGIYQVTTKYLKTGKEEKMDFMVMENLFFGRTILRTYDLKGSIRSRYNPETSGVLLDENFLEMLRTNPIFLRSQDKHCLERAVWNDTSFLASVDVMDYSLLVGVDEERNELVLGIIDFMRQYTWDKHLETWAKTAGILRGQISEPTVISPKQYKKRFRRAMASYFLVVPEQ